VCFVHELTVFILLAQKKLPEQVSYSGSAPRPRRIGSDYCSSPKPSRIDLEPHKGHLASKANYSRRFRHCQTTEYDPTDQASAL